MVTGVNQRDPGPSHVGQPYSWPLGAIVLCLLKAKCQRAGCSSSGPGCAFLGASPCLHPWGRASITIIPFRVGGRCGVTALQHPPTPDFPGTCRITEVRPQRRLYFRFTEILHPATAPRRLYWLYFRQENWGPSSFEAPSILPLLPSGLPAGRIWEALFQLVCTK